MSWRDTANKFILEAKAEGERQGLTGRHLERFVSENGYPFGPRKYHPYKIWCSAFNVIMRGKSFPRIRNPQPVKGQLSFFGDTND